MRNHRLGLSWDDAVNSVESGVSNVWNTLSGDAQNFVSQNPDQFPANGGDTVAAGTQPETDVGTPIINAWNNDVVAPLQNELSSITGGFVSTLDTMLLLGVGAALIFFALEKK